VTPETSQYIRWAAKHLAVALAWEMMSRTVGALIDLHPRLALANARRAREYIKEVWR
jgi:hypothetical protein